MQDLSLQLKDFFNCNLRAFRHAGSVVVTGSLSCPAACGMLLPQPGIRPASAELEGRFLTSEQSGKSHNIVMHFSTIYLYYVYVPK